MTCGIYEIWINDYFYQGSSKNIEQRIYDHKRELKKSRHDNPKMQSVYNKYNTFEYQILVECDEVALLKWEQDYIDANWGDEKYLNLNPFAAKPPGNKGKKFSEEHKRKMSEANKGRKLSEEHIRKLSESHKGIRLSDETKRKLSEIHKGKKLSDETRRKISEAKNPKGFTWCKDKNKFRAQITINGKTKYLGYYNTEAEARQAYLDAKAIYHIMPS